MKMNPAPQSPSLRVFRDGVRMAALVAAFAFAAPARAGDAYPLIPPIEGGLSPSANIISMVVTNGKATIQWNGFQGPFILQGKSALTDTTWQTIGNAGDQNWLSFAADNELKFFRVQAPAPQYASADGGCVNCHESTHQGWSMTPHATALDTLVKIGMGDNPECLKCHTVAYGIETGFKTRIDTPQFGGVQCENCHGPAAAHVANPDDSSLRPVLTPSGNLCGGCHSGFHHPTYENWTSTPHAKVDPHVQSYFLDPNTTTAQARMTSCGACHSSAVRQAMIRAKNQNTAVVLPSGHDAADNGVTCIVCHDPHTPGNALLRYPEASTNFFSYNTATTTSFAAQYDPTVQTCGQCHNQRGAAPSDTSRPPHHSPQYNVLIGDIGVAAGYVPGAASPGTHASLEKQCATCHVHSTTPANPSPTNPADTGHTFQPNLEVCSACHDSAAAAETRIANTQTDIKARIAEVKALLDQWASTKAPDALRTKYGALAWEYNAPGQLSNPTGATTIVGPTSTEQAGVVTDIKKARMYLYMVEHDGSYGVHNAKYARFLLDTAKTNVTTLLNGP